MAAVINLSDDGADEPLVSVEPLDDGRNHSLVGRRVQTRHLSRGQPDQVGMLYNFFFFVTDVALLAFTAETDFW